MEEATHREYAEQEAGHWWFVARRRILTELLGPPSPPGLRILDIGAGPGAEWLSPWGTLVSTDRRVEALAPKARGVCADARQLPVKTGSVDRVCAFDVLEHLDDDRAGLLEMKRVCRPGGRIWVTVPALPWLWSEHDRVNQHRRRYLASSLSALAEAGGCRVLRMTYFNALILPPAAAWRLLPRSRQAGSDLGYSGGGCGGSLLAGLASLERFPLRVCNLPLGLSLFAALEPR